jgi:DNA-binding NarL/FixJ family response regulator
VVEGTMPVVVASGSPAFAQGLADFLSEPPLAPVVVHSAQAALDAVRAHRPALVVVDTHLADGPGAELTRELSLRHPEVRIVTAASGGEDPAVAAGAAAGRIDPAWDRPLVVEAVADALRGHGRVDAAVVRALAGGALPGALADAHLTDQERVVLRLMRQHLTYKEIARELGLSWHTVRTHAQSILRKTGVHSRRDLVVRDASRAVTGGR